MNEWMKNERTWRDDCHKVELYRWVESVCLCVFVFLYCGLPSKSMCILCPKILITQHLSHSFHYAHRAVYALRNKIVTLNSDNSSLYGGNESLAVLSELPSEVAELLSKVRPCTAI